MSSPSFCARALYSAARRSVRGFWMRASPFRYRQSKAYRHTCATIQSRRSTVQPQLTMLSGQSALGACIADRVACTLIGSCACARDCLDYRRCC